MKRILILTWLAVLAAGCGDEAAHEPVNSGDSDTAAEISTETPAEDLPETAAGEVTPVRSMDPEETVTDFTPSDDVEIEDEFIAEDVE